jgi:Integrase core domain
MLEFNSPGKRTHNAFVEAFDGSFCTVCPNTHAFPTLDDTRSKI